MPGITKTHRSLLPLLPIAGQTPVGGAASGQRVPDVACVQKPDRAVGSWAVGSRAVGSWAVGSRAGRRT
jgi:hypothetical protein